MPGLGSEILIAIVGPADPRQTTRAPRQPPTQIFERQRRWGDGLAALSPLRLFEEQSAGLTSTGFGGH